MEVKIIFQNFPFSVEFFDRAKTKLFRNSLLNSQQIYSAYACSMEPRKIFPLLMLPQDPFPRNQLSCSFEFLFLDYFIKKRFLKICFSSKFKIPFHTFVIRQT